jgi:sulfur relay (sulfurtransferase) complex TusBCD TusD component (DsrE family)
MADESQEKALLTELFGEPKPPTQEQLDAEAEYQKTSAFLAYETAEALADARGRLADTSDFLQDAVAYSEQYGRGASEVRDLQGAFRVLAEQLKTASLEWAAISADHGGYVPE